jgi:hypothetical protein
METTFKKDEIRQQAIEALEDLKGSSIDGADLHHEIFNTDYYIIGTYDAKQWLGSHAFDVIETIREYEQDNFGQVSTDFSDPEKVVNMYVYIVGEEVLQESKTLQKLWDKKLDDEDLEAIKAELEG